MSFRGRVSARGISPYQDVLRVIPNPKGEGSHVPSKEEFTRLREYMGARSGTNEGYSAQVLPNLSGYGFWSSSVNPRYAGYTYYFSGTIGSFDEKVRGENFGYYSPAVRCVVGR